jgi:hypothetical protein
MTYLSKCCKAKVKVDSNGTTGFHVCTKCNKACNTEPDGAEEYFKEWSSICRIQRKSNMIGISYEDLIEIMNGFHQKEMHRKLEEAEKHFKYSSKKRSIDFVHGALSLLTHLKEQKT